MNKKKILKTIGLIVIVLAILTIFYNLYKFFSTGKLVISVNANSIYYIDSDINVLVSVNKFEDNKQIKSTVKAQMYDSEGKKVKKAKSKIDLEKGEVGEISLNTTDDLETGEYTLKLSANSGFQNVKTEIPISIINEKNANVVIYLDKGIYKPGDQINYRTLIVSSKDYTPIEQEVNVYIYDGNDNKVYSETTTTSEYGIISGNFKLADEVNSGTYKIVIATENKEYDKTFTVNPYITPKFETTISTDKETYLVGDTAQITISSKYFFGEPVTGAEVKGRLNDTDIIGLTNSEGNFVTTYEFNSEEKLNLEFTVTDTSNYAIDASKTVACGTDIFEIELLPEYGDIVEGIDNEIYLITKDANGNPVKTYSNIKIDTTTKQVITDENGIGKFILTSNEISNSDFDYTMKFNKQEKCLNISVSSENMDGQKISKKLEISLLSNPGALLKTDKIKYNEGDDITVSVNSKTESISNLIYVYKNNELLKTISFEENETTFNLEKMSGLIDIYILTQNNTYNKKTIFVKPNKTLNIGIKTDSEEYKPGDKLNIQFTTTDENNQSVESALLVSILDEAVLQLADNDLSIDNIKLALQDIKLTEEITAADLYASVLDDSSDIAIQTVLLKQDNTEPSITTKVYKDNDSGKYLGNAILIAVIALVVVILYFVLRSARTREIIIAFIDTTAIFIIVLMILTSIDSLYYMDEIIILGVSLVTAVILYTLVLYKEKKYIFNLIRELILIPFITVFLLCVLGGIIENVLDIEVYGILYIICGLIALAGFAYTTVISRNGEITKIESIIKTICTSLVKAFIFMVATKLVMEITEFGFVLVLGVYILFDRVILNKNNKSNRIKNGRIILNVTTGDLVAIIAGISLLLIVGAIYVYNSAQSTIQERDIWDIRTVPNTNDSYTTSSSSVLEEMNPAGLSSQSMFSSALDTTGTSKINGSIFDDLDIFTSFSSTFEDVNDSSLTSAIDMEQNIDFDETTEESVKDDSYVQENVRNIFLESLAFIPELVTENGSAQTTINISDNITTWNIQTVGNTKQGNIGYVSSSFKVFKEFFVDFSVPNNSVVTDQISIPVTLYNYTESDLNIDIKVIENDWCKIGEYTNSISVPANSTSMIYVPIEMIKDGDNIIRIEAKSGSISDIVEKNVTVKLNGLEKQEVAASGIIEKKYSQDIIFNEDIIENSKKLKVKLYPTPVAQAVEGIENILEMPTGCFEQTSSSLYPDILVLEYLRKYELNNTELEKKALNYISKGYQKLLTYEVDGEKGGYSLYGSSPAEPVITAFGLMEFNELSNVYNVDDKVIKNMKEYLFTEQKSNGTFNFSSTYIGGAANTSNLSMNAYIIWALSEVCPKDSRLESSIKYLERNFNNATDPYTLALIANVFVNTDSNKKDEVISELMGILNSNKNGTYIETTTSDYYGTRGKYQNIQATALTSIALSKLGKESKNNKELVNYIIGQKDSRGTWGTTQATILALKAINEFNAESEIKEQVITIACNGEEKTVKIEKNALDFYEFEFENVSTENNVSISFEKGQITYEIIKEYYIEYSNIENTNSIILTQDIDTKSKVNDTINQKITIINSKEKIANGLVQINIPQGTSVVEDSLLKLTYEGLIEKYEYNYNKINIYLKDIKVSDLIEFDIQYKALYPANITGASVRVFDYYNPDIEETCSPVNIEITE